MKDRYHERQFTAAAVGPCTFIDREKRREHTGL